MADRGTSKSPNTRNPDRPASHPSRMDQFADDAQDDRLAPDGEEISAELGVTSNKERRVLQKILEKKNI